MHWKCIKIHNLLRFKPSDSLCWFFFFPPDHTERRGLVTLRGHGCAVFATHGRYLEFPQVLQWDPAGSHGAGTRGAKDRMVQPLRPPSFLRNDRGQLWRHADEPHKDPQHSLQSKFILTTQMWIYAKIKVTFRWYVINLLTSEMWKSTPKSLNYNNSSAVYAVSTIPTDSDAEKSG